MNINPQEVYPQIGIRWLFTLLFVFATTLSLVGCDSESEGTADEAQGEIVIGLTDAEGDFLTYSVDVMSLRLTRKDGTEVETLPLTTTVDFAQYTDVTEFLTVATVPAGEYVSATLELDYSNAKIVVQDATGKPLDAVAVNEEGDPLGQEEMEVQLSSGNRFTIAPGVPAHITLDFDLESTHSIDLSQSPAVVTVEPVLIADPLLTAPKSHRLRGLLRSVSTDDDQFSVSVRPYHRITGQFGTLLVSTLEDTVYELDGTTYSGKQGLDQLAQMVPSTAIVVNGQLNTQSSNEPRFEAAEVYAGSSVPWGDKDIITGHVVARSGDLLTLRGATVVRSNNSVVFDDEVKIMLGRTTHVSQQAGFDEPLDKDAISVGQYITAIGTLADSTSDNLQLDATQGHVRLLWTQLFAKVVQSTPLVVDLQSIDGRRIEIFDFQGTGSAEDSDPDRYEIATGNLSLHHLTLNDLVTIRGFVTPFGEAPKDFQAQTVVNVLDLPATLAVRWKNGGVTTPFTSLSPINLVLNLSASTLGNLHHVFRHGAATDLLSSNVNPTIIPDSTRPGVYTIAQNRTMLVFSDFANFETALANKLNGSTRLMQLQANGVFSDNQFSLTTRRVVARLRR
jgi:hypothetical protein